MKLTYDHQFANLPPVFYTRMEAQGIATAPRLIHANPEVAKLIGLDPYSLNTEEFYQTFSGNKMPPSSAPLAMVYSGHQFGVWAGQLGDGRALLIGQVRNEFGELWDIQIKGAGLTPYSRMGDGRAVLRSCIREYLCSEAMAALDIPTTRALAVIASGEDVYRERREPGAVLTRVARSHIRFGHFEHFFYCGDHESLGLLADYVQRVHYPNCASHTDWFAELVHRTARLIAQWQAVGFCHGVMNTDNMSIVGDTIDYGPFGFLDDFNPEYVCNHSDNMGRYACNRQPEIAHWNLQALAWALQPLIPLEESGQSIAKFQDEFESHYYQIMREKFGLSSNTQKSLNVQNLDEVWEPILVEMAHQRVDYTQAMRCLSDILIEPYEDGEAKWLALFANPKPAKSHLDIWRKALEHVNKGLSSESIALRMRRVSPKYVLRNWIAEKAIRDVEDHNDLSSIQDIFTILRTPFEEHPELEAYAMPPPPEFAGLAVSCSS